jgi:hypothetical protein
MGRFEQNDGRLVRRRRGNFGVHQLDGIPRAAVRETRNPGRLPGLSCVTPPASVMQKSRATTLA